MGTVSEESDASMGLKSAITKIHSLLKSKNIDHALIGGFALAVHGINRATGDLDLLVDENDKDQLLQVLDHAGYKVMSSTEDVVHLEGSVHLDILFARRPIARKMLSHATPAQGLEVKCVGPEDLIGLKIQAYCNDPRRELQDKADIQFLIRKYPQMNWKQVQEYAELFGEWNAIQEIKRLP